MARQNINWFYDTVAPYGITRENFEELNGYRLENTPDSEMENIKFNMEEASQLGILPYFEIVKEEPKRKL